MKLPFQLIFQRYRTAQFAIDLAVSAVALPLAYLIRFEGLVPTVYIYQLLFVLPLALIVRMGCRGIAGVHQHLWRYVSLRDAIDIAFAITLGTISLVLLTRVGLHIRLPWGVIAHDWWLNLLGFLAVRALRRAYTERELGVAPQGQQPGKVLLVGAGQAGNTVAREIMRQSRGLEVVGFIDDDRSKLGSRVQGIPVLGTTTDIPRLVTMHEVEKILLCIPSASNTDMRRIIEVCRETKAKVQTVPGLRDLIGKDIELNNIREVQIEDLLNRDPISFDRDSASAYLAGRVVMVTGAGGSIGSELCRQIAALAPCRLILVGRGEFSIYSIEMELRESFPSLDLIPVIADIRDINRMSGVFTRYTPDVVFHAAAHKHVPLMEKNPGEAVLNNVFGTRNVAELASKHNVETFVLVSTDKAVNPTNVMGATKRVAELLIQELAGRSQTRYMCVRFGNVLGSRGSVIPLFKRQIAQGGPITITHPDIIRYFMTIPEATQLVLQAGAVGKGGEVFVLDMGAPVKIVDLAKDMIRLSGFEPDLDIKIKFTGLRPGEKLYEELLTAEEGTTSTVYKKIFVARPDPLNSTKLELGLTLLQSAAMTGDDQAIRRGLQALVNTYNYQPKVSEGPPSSVG